MTVRPITLITLIIMVLLGFVRQDAVAQPAGNAYGLVYLTDRPGKSPFVCVDGSIRSKDMFWQVWSSSTLSHLWSGADWGYIGPDSMTMTEELKTQPACTMFFGPADSVQGVMKDYGATKLAPQWMTAAEFTALAEQAKHIQAQKIYALLTCRLGTIPLPVFQCIGPTGPAHLGGTFKIRNGNSVRTYAAMDIYQEFASSEVRIKLNTPFAIIAQSNGNNNMVLRLEIRDGGDKVLYSDEATEFSTIRVAHK